MPLVKAVEKQIFKHHHHHKWVAINETLLPGTCQKNVKEASPNTRN